MTPRQALSFVRRHGIVFESAHGPIPSLAAAIAGERIRGSWWKHAKSHEIFELTRRVRESAEILVCRLVDRKITFVHRRLWPALVRIAGDLPPERLTMVRERHTDTGRHVIKEVPYPRWVPEEVYIEAKRLTREAAIEAFGAWFRSYRNAQLDRTHNRMRTKVTLP